jgi:hypothetical protein
MKKLLLTITILAIGLTANSQILISLLLGDKLNSPNIEFGIDGGVNFANIANLEASKPMHIFNMGFYFDFKLKENLMIHTGVQVKQSQGAKGINPYNLGNDILDSLYVNGSVERRINYFSVPILLKYRFAGFFHIEAGPMLSLRTKGYDKFLTSVKETDDASYKLDIKNQYKRIDAGVMVGAGFKLSKAPKSAQAGIRYYYGLIDPLKSNTGKSQNYSSLYLYFSIPIGVAKTDSKQN